MQISITGKQIDVGTAFQTYAEERLSDAVGKYFEDGNDASVTVLRAGQALRVNISVRAGRGVVVQAHADGDTAHLALDGAVERIAKRLRRHKRRLSDHNRRERAKAKEDSLTAQRYIIAAPDEDGPEEDDAAGDNPTIIAETTREIDTLTVGEAVMRMDLADRAAYVFRNAANGRINVVYRRRDGNIGWIDPAPEASAR